jgi:DNA-directed RNA polymerase subunit RPC12/RpoP
MRRRMGLFDKLFQLMRSDEYYERNSKAKSSPDGYPVCPFCSYKYDVKAKALKRIAKQQGNVFYVCSGCKKLVKP